MNNAPAKFRFSRRKALRSAAAALAAGAAYPAVTHIGLPLADRLLAPAPSTNVLFILIDTLRASHLGCRGYHRDTSPNIDDLAASASLFTNHKSPSSMTTASMAQIFLSRTSPTHTIPKHSVPLAERLRRAGWHTAAVQTNPWLDASAGFTRGFDSYTNLAPPTGDPGVHTLANWWNAATSNVFYMDAEAVFASAREFLDSAPAGPFFLYLHFMDVHGPYIPKPPFDLFSAEKRPFAEKLRISSDFIKAGYASRFDELALLRDDTIALYDGQIREVDHAVGNLLTLLREKRLLDNTLVVLTSDHGEEFGEHDLVQHSNGVFETLIDTPLIIKAPGRTAPALHTTLARGIDVAPTILHALGFSPWHLSRFGCEGIPLLNPDSPRPSLATSLLVKTREHRPLGYFSVQDPDTGFKLILETDRRRVARTMLFNLFADPAETVNLASDRPETVASLAENLVGMRNLLKVENPLDSLPLSPEKERRLRALGYLN